MTQQQREHAIACAKYVSGKLPNGPTAGDFRRASISRNEDILLAIHFIIEYYENNRAQAAAIS